MIKKLLKKIINVLGYDIVKKEGFDYFSIYKKLYDEQTLNERRFYNIGAGLFNHPYWTNVDKKSDWYSESQECKAFINYDLFSLEKLEIEDDNAEIIYSSHVVEHISDEAAQHMFKEVFRILKPGGIFRLTMPDMKLAYRALMNDDRDFFYWIDEYSIPENMARIHLKTPMNEASIEQIFLHHFTTQLAEIMDIESNQKVSDSQLRQIFEKNEYQEALNMISSKCSLEIQHLYPGFHMNWWDEDKCFKMLNLAGFEKIFRSGYGQSFSPVLRDTNYFDGTHYNHSLYIEAIK